MRVASRRTVTNELRARVREELITALAAANEPDAVLEVASNHCASSDVFPGDLLIDLAADALEVAGVTRTSPIEAAELRERMLPEHQFSGNTEHQKSWAALRAVGMTYAGVRPDLGYDVGWWKVNDFWYFAALSFVIYVRAAADHGQVPVAEICGRIAAKPG
jgi:hypothetical protein